MSKPTAQEVHARNNEKRAMEQRDAQIIAQTFLKAHPFCLRFFSSSIVTLMVEGFILRRVISALAEGRPHGERDAVTLRRLVNDVLEAAQIIDQTCRICHGRERDHEETDHDFEPASLGPRSTSS